MVLCSIEILSKTENCTFTFGRKSVSSVQGLPLGPFHLSLLPHVETDTILESPQDRSRSKTGSGTLFTNR